MKPGDAQFAVPPGVVTETVTVPAARAGVVTLIWLGLMTVNEVAAVPPKVTEVAPVKFEPLIVTGVPPAVLPLGGLTLPIMGAWA